MILPVRRVWPSAQARLSTGACRRAKVRTRPDSGPRFGRLSRRKETLWRVTKFPSLSSRNGMMFDK